MQNPQTRISKIEPIKISIAPTLIKLSSLDTHETYCKNKCLIKHVVFVFYPLMDDDDNADKCNGKLHNRIFPPNWASVNFPRD